MRGAAVRRESARIFVTVVSRRGEEQGRRIATWAGDERELSAEQVGPEVVLWHQVAVK